jgi:L-amino acid N-acyltransferase YncA
MFPEQIKNFREMVTLKDGAYILLRPMAPEDKQRLVEYYAAVSTEDLRYFRDYKVKDPAFIQEWCDGLNYAKVLPLLALAKDRVIGSASLHFFEGPKRHIGEVRLFLPKESRKRGLGMKMIRALIDLARKNNLSLLYGEVVADMSKVVRAFEQLGFTPQATLEDFFMFPDGDLCDIVLMTMSLRPKTDEF